MCCCRFTRGAGHERQLVTTFAELGLAEPILKVLDAEGYTQPTPIQSQAIPVVLSGRDLMGIAQTGTGKTAAFALPIIDQLSRNPRPTPRGGCRVLVLSPTRELTNQIADSFRTYGRKLNLKVGVVVGGVSHRPQIEALRRGLDVLVATPGRLIDHLDARAMALTSTEVFVLDEADQMLDLGFVKPIRRIASGLSQRCQSLLFSATMPREIADLAKEFLDNPSHVAVTPQATTVERIDQRIIHVESRRKRTLLAELLANEQMVRTLVFTRTKRGADRVAKYLEVASIKAAAIHGNKSQNQREAALRAFRNASVRVLVATDIAARGIDVDGVTHVVNYELPEVPEAYVHRIGRTARAGADGAAISFCDNAEHDLLRNIERVTRQRIKAESRLGCAILEAAAKEMPDTGPAERWPDRTKDRREGQRSRPKHSRSAYVPREAHGADGRDGEARPARDDTNARRNNGHRQFRSDGAPRQAGAGSSHEGGRDRGHERSHERGYAGHDRGHAGARDRRPSRGSYQPRDSAPSGHRGSRSDGEMRQSSEGGYRSRDGASRPKRHRGSGPR